MLPPFQTASLLHSPKPARMLGVESRDPCSEGPWLLQLFLTGPLYLLIYFPDCCLILLELLPPQPSGGSRRGRSWSLSSWCCEELEGRLSSLLRSHLKLLQGSAPWGGAHTGYPGRVEVRSDLVSLPSGQRQNFTSTSMPLPHQLTPLVARAGVVCFSHLLAVQKGRALWPSGAHPAIKRLELVSRPEPPHSTPIPPSRGA